MIFLLETPTSTWLTKIFTILEGYSLLPQKMAPSFGKLGENRPKENLALRLPRYWISMEMELRILLLGNQTAPFIPFLISRKSLGVFIFLVEAAELNCTILKMIIHFLDIE